MAELRATGEVLELVLTAEAGKPPTLDLGSLAQISELLEEAREGVRRGICRMLTIRSASDRYFCVGANIRALAGLNESTMGEWIERGHAVMNRIETFPAPTLAIVKGYTMGGGLELALSCDLIYADLTAKFSQSEAKLGFIPGWGGTRRLRNRIGEARAKRLYYTGEIIGAEAAAQIGLIDYVGEGDSLEREVEGFAAAVGDVSGEAVSAFKEIMSRQTEEARISNTADEKRWSVDCIRSSDTMTRVKTFLESRGSR